MKYRKKAEALLQYAIMITIVALALATMHTYLRRSIQAKVKDLTDQIISERQLATLNDFVTEVSTKDIQSTYSLQKNEGVGGMSSLSATSAYTIETKHEVENLETVDYGRGVAGVRRNPSTDFSAHRYRGTGQNSSGSSGGSE